MAESSWIIPAITAGAGLIGSGILAFVSLKSGKMQIENQRHIESMKFEREKSESDRKLRIEKIEKKMEVYNKVLQADGESVVTRPMGPYTEFQVNVYSEKIRPILYGSFHMLDDEVKIAVREIDVVVKKLLLKNKLEYQEDDEASKAYEYLISYIERHYITYIDQIM